MSQANKVTFRGMTVSDTTQVTRWLQEDADHQSADERIFTDPVIGRSQFAVEIDGEIAFYVATENVARVHIQFDPAKTGSRKNTKALILGFTWLQKQLKERGYFEVLFDSRVPRLVRFCQKVLGFLKLDQDYSVRL